MVLTRAALGRSLNCSVELDFTMCKYHYTVVNIAYCDYLIDEEEARSVAWWQAKACHDCEDPQK